MTNEVISLLKENNIILIRVPANLTHIFQPLDLPCRPLFGRSLLAKFLAAGQIRAGQLRAGQIRA